MTNYDYPSLQFRVKYTGLTLSNPVECNNQFTVVIFTIGFEKIAPAKEKYFYTATV